jgi:hypothetical protein
MTTVTITVLGEVLHQSKVCVHYDSKLIVMLYVIPTFPLHNKIKNAIFLKRIATVECLTL